MVYLNQIKQFLNNYLIVGAFQGDNAFNGVNIEGRNKIKKIAFGVSPNMELFKKAEKWGADMLITHHAIFTKSGLENGLTGVIKDRVKFLLDKNISLLCYHLPLDFHKEVGNNILLLNKLGADFKKRFGKHAGFNDIFFVGEFEKPILRGELAKKIAKILGQKTENILFGKKKIKTVSIVTGGGASASILIQLPSEKIDLYLTGEIKEDTPHLAKEMKLNFISGGHYATEIFGVQALAKKLKKKFKVETKFFGIKVPY